MTGCHCTLSPPSPAPARRWPGSSAARPGFTKVCKCVTAGRTPGTKMIPNVHAKGKIKIKKKQQQQQHAFGGVAARRGALKEKGEGEV